MMENAALREILEDYVIAEYPGTIDEIIARIEAHREDKEWITDWKEWDFVGQEYIEWSDRDVLLNIGKLVHGRATAAPNTINMLMDRLEAMLSDYWVMKVMIRDELKDRYAHLPEWVARENEGSSPWERGET